MQIETSVPLPERLPNAKYPFSRMAVGESFVTDREQKAVASAAANWSKKRPGTAFRTSSRGGSVRCWRVA